MSGVHLEINTEPRQVQLQLEVFLNNNCNNSFLSLILITLIETLVTSSLLNNSANKTPTLKRVNKGPQAIELLTLNLYMHQDSRIDLTFNSSSHLSHNNNPWSSIQRRKTLLGLVFQNLILWINSKEMMRMSEANSLCDRKHLLIGHISTILDKWIRWGNSLMKVRVISPLNVALGKTNYI